MPWHKVSTTVSAVSTIIFQMKKSKYRATQVIWLQSTGLQSFYSCPMKKPRNKELNDKSVIHHARGRMRIWNLGLLPPDLAPVFPPHPVVLGYQSTRERTGDGSAKMSVAQQLVPSHCEQNRASLRSAEVQEDYGPLQPRQVGGGTVSQSRNAVPENSPSCYHCYLWCVCSDTWAKEGSFPTGSSLNSAKHTKLCFKPK